MKLCVRAECRPLSRPSRNGRVRGDRQQQRQHRAQAVADAHRAVDVAHADVHVQAEGVVAPGDVLEALLDAAVVLGVDDRLLAVVGPRVRPGRAERDALRAPASANSAPAALALARQRVAAGRRRRPEMISISEEISSPATPRAAAGRSAAPSRSSSKRGTSSSVSRVEDRELLLDADGEVGRGANVSTARSRSRLFIAWRLRAVSREALGRPV